MARSIVDYGLCPYCLQGNYRTLEGCSWSDENPDVARAGVDKPCEADRWERAGQAEARRVRRNFWIVTLVFAIGLAALIFFMQRGLVWLD